MKRILLGVAFFLVLAGVKIDPVMAQEMSVDTIVQKANLAAYYSGKDGMSAGPSLH